MASRSARKPRKRPRPTIRMVGTVEVEPGHPAPLVAITGADTLDQMAADRAIQETGLQEWVRVIRPDDAPDPSRAIDPTPRGLADAERMAHDITGATHMYVRVIAKGIRSRVPLTVLPKAILN